MTRVQDPSGLADRDMRNPKTCYGAFVGEADAFRQLVVDWYTTYREAKGEPGEPARSDEHHGFYRCVSFETLTMFGTPRRALQDAWPLPEGLQPERVEPEPLPPSRIVPLIAEGQHLRGADGSRFTARCATDFRLFERWLRGEDITPIVDQRIACGYNMVRVLGTCDFMFRLYPQEHPQYYDALHAFRQFLEGRGLYLQFTAFADATKVMPNLSDQLAYWTSIGSALRDSATLVELVNENDQTINHVDTVRFPRLPDVMCSHGSNGSQAAPVEPHWDFATFHTNGASEEQRKVGHNAMEIWDGPTLTNETSRYPEVGMWTTGDMSIDRQKMLAYDSGAGAALQCVGFCFHSVHGKQSELWDGYEEIVAREMAHGALSVPLEFQDGAYIRRDDLTWQPQPPPPPLGQVLRAYERRLPDGRGHVVLIHA